MHNGKEEKRNTPPRGGHGPMRTIEKPKNFGEALSKLFKSLNDFKVLLIISLVLAGLSAILALVSPDRLSDLTDEISKGLTINTTNMEKLQDDLLTNLNEETFAGILNLNIDESTIYKVNTASISALDKEKFNNTISAMTKENATTSLGKLPDSVLDIILEDSTYNDILITKEDKINLLKSLSNYNSETKDYSFITKLPDSINNVLFPSSTIDNIEITTKDKVEFISKMSTLKKDASVNEIYKIVETLPNSIQKLVNPKMNVEKIREMYPEGTQIVLTEMAGESQMPYGLKGTVKFVDDAGQIHMSWENGSSLALNINEDTFEKAGERYETMMTAPRQDMGDSISKAFRNVDDILNDLGVEATEENRRAVRILGYNGIEITEDSIIQMKAADEEVQRMFKNMTPAVVTQLIKQGINPLEMKISDLNRVAEQVRSEVGKDDNQKFSEYLYKLEKNNQITEEERNSYIGIYRLIHQVEQTDGAAIGALVNQGAEMTMKNLLTAVRSSHKTNRMDISVDNDYGESKEQTVNTNSITDQIETAYQTNCMKDAADLLTPGRLQQVFDQHPDWQNMTPEEFAHALAETVDTDAAAEREYLQEQMRMVQEAAAAPDEIYRMLEQFDLPNSAMNVNAIQSMMANRNQLFRQIFGEESTNPDREKKITAEDIEAIKESIIEDFGEAVSEPKALAEVQETLGKVAENVMKTMISSDEVTSIDVREMRLMQAKLSINQTLAKKEQYSIPVLVGDKVTNVSLKIVRGVETKGIVDIMLESEMSGKIAATFQAKEEGISGLVVTDKQETRDLLADQMGFLASAIQESDGEQVDLRFAIEKNLDLNHFSGVASGKSGNVTSVNDSAASTKEAVDKEGQSTEGKKEDSVYKVQTARLYHIAEAFLKTIREFE